MSLTLNDVALKRADSRPITHLEVINTPPPPLGYAMEEASVTDTSPGMSEDSSAEVSEQLEEENRPPIFSANKAAVQYI